jgi:tetratricopeptide (TPR) repeat protein
MAAACSVIDSQQKVLVALARGRLDSARAEIRASTRQMLDDEAQRQVLALPLSAFDNDPASRGIVLAQLYHLRGDRLRAAVYADSARIAFEEQSRAAPGDPQRHVLLGLAMAYLGRKADAVREGRRAVELLPISRDAVTGAYLQYQLARIYLLVGEPEKALDQLEPLLRIPYYLTPAWLGIDPTLDPLRSNPRFRKLEGTA